MLLNAEFVYSLLILISSQWKNDPRQEDEKNESIAKYGEELLEEQENVDAEEVEHWRSGRRRRTTSLGMGPSQALRI